MAKLNIENEYETDDDLVFCYPDVEVDKIHYLVLDVLYRDEDLAPHFMAIQDICSEMALFLLHLEVVSNGNSWV